MAARILFLSILFTEVLRPACLAGVRGASGGVRGLNGPKSGNLELGLAIRLEAESSGNVLVGSEGAVLNRATGARQNVLWLRNSTATPPCGLAQCDYSTEGRARLKTAKKRGDQTTKNGANKRPRNPTPYRCVVNNNSGSFRSTPTSLKIPYLSHKFNKSPQNVTVREGEVARLSCCIDSFPSPPNITWLRDNKPLISDDKTKYLMVSPGVLYINATKLSDAGSYRCAVTKSSSKRKTRKSRKANLRVIPVLEGGKSDLPTLLLPQISYSYQITVGSDLTLVCASSGFPSLVFWTFTPQLRDGASVTKPRTLLNSTNGIAVSTLRNVRIADQGDYRCSVENFGQILQTQTITVEVLIAPTFLIKPNGQEERSGKSVRFECQAQGRPMPKIYWLKDSKPLDMNPRLGTYMKENNKMALTISSTIPDDSGVYQCVAVNPAGEISVAAPLKINYLPQSPPAPVSLKCRASSPNTILVSWESPRTFSSSNITTWITIHYAIMEPGSRENILPEENSPFIEVVALEPFTNYSLYARRWTKHAASNQSATVQCSTAARSMGTNDGKLTYSDKFVPTAAPIVTLQPIGSTKLNVSWLPLNKKEARGYIVQYKLQWRVEGLPSTKIRNLPSTVNQYVLPDLIPGMRYEVRILARTKQGWPNVSDSRFNWTRIIMPLPNASRSLLTNIVDFHVINVDASTIKVEWRLNEETDRPEKNFDLWMLYYENRVGKKLLTIALPRNCTEYLFTEIESDASYRIRLCMVRYGESEVCLSRQLDSQRPVDENAGINLEGFPLSSTSINVSWSAEVPNFERYYEVCHSPAYSADSEPPICLNTTDVTVTISALKPYSLYEFNVKVLYNTTEQPSPYSETIECYTDEDVPDAVRNLDWFLSNFVEVRIIWAKPETSNGVIRNYTVYYTSSPLSTSPEKWANLTVPGNETTANLPDLAYSTQYLVEVRAATNRGYGKSSGKMTIHTAPPPRNSSDQHGHSPPATPMADQSLGIIVGVSISTCCIIICLSSIYCRRKWENIQSSRQSSQTLKDRVILRNGNGCCTERNSVGTGQRLPTATATNDIELAVLCLPSPKTTNPHDRRINGIVEPCVKEPLLTPWHMNGDSKDLNITENPQYKQRRSSDSNQQAEQELDGTQVTMLNYTADSSGSSLNNNLERSESLSSLEQVPSTSIPVLGPNG